MTDPNDPRRPLDDEDDGGAETLPIDELRDLRIDLGGDLGGRVLRDINRRTLAADSLDFSFNVMLSTFWEHLRSVIESWPIHGAEQPPADRPPEE